MMLFLRRSGLGFAKALKDRLLETPKETSDELGWDAGRKEALSLDPRILKKHSLTKEV